MGNYVKLILLGLITIVAALAVAYAFYLFFFRRTDW